MLSESRFQKSFLFSATNSHQYGILRSFKPRKLVNHTHNIVYCRKATDFHILFFSSYQRQMTVQPSTKSINELFIVPSSFFDEYILNCNFPPHSIMVSLSFLPYLSSLLPVNRPIRGDSPLEQCDITTSQSLKLNYVDIFPNPPVRGENLTISASGFLNEDVIDGAYVDVVVNYGYIRLLSQTYDLCEELPNVDMTCPIQKGNYNLVKQVEIPNEVPPGKYTVFARAYNADDSMITCLTGSIEFPAAIL